jgi:hypothetical protein
MKNKLIAYLSGRNYWAQAKRILFWLDLYKRFQSRFKKPTYHIEKDYQGEPILLIALFQKGKLRPDLVRLLEIAKAKGLYVLAINNLRVKTPTNMERFADFYIERFNYGRDFGAYQFGFQHIFKKKWHLKCPRLIMANDSLYYATKGLDEFLEDMINSDKEVLGATENFEIEYHLGSFWISIGQAVLRKKRFIRYWNRYKQTDIRPKVIHRGEMKLSKVLKRSISSPDMMSALYSSSRFHREIQISDELLDFSIRSVVTSEGTDWMKFTVKKVIDAGHQTFLGRKYDIQGALAQIDASLDEINQSVFIGGFSQIKEILTMHLSNYGKLEEGMIRELVVALRAEIFMSGSQVHQNGPVLVRMGLPFVKMDGMYRGVYNLYDVGKITCQLLAEERYELQELLINRPWGEKTLTKWKLAAFRKGLL